MGTSQTALSFLPFAIASHPWATCYRLNYTRPFSCCSCLIVLFLFGTVAATADLTLGFQSIFAQTGWFLFYAVQITTVLIDPRTCIYTTTTLNGLKVKICRPLIGFAGCKTQEITTGESTLHGRPLLRRSGMFG